MEGVSQADGVSFSSFFLHSSADELVPSTQMFMFEIQLRISKVLPVVGFLLSIESLAVCQLVTLRASAVVSVKV